MHSLRLDLVTALRFFARRRGAFAVIALTIALAIGANTAVFSVLRAFLFARLGVAEPGRVVLVWTTYDLPGRGRVDFSDAYVNYRLLRASTRSFESIAATLSADVNWENGDDTRRLQGARAVAHFFDLMRVRPALGRVFTAPEEGPRAAHVAVIGDALWREAFGGRSDVLGRTVQLNGTPHTIIGVMPAGFGQPQGTEIWLPFDLPENLWTAIVGGRQLNNYARLAPGVTIAGANAELREFAARAVAADANNKDWSWRAQPLRESILAGAGNTLIFVQTGAVVLLLLAMSNLASVLMAWAAERQRETALRLALGASGGRLVRQYLVQSLMLVLVGGGLGVGVAAAALPLLRGLTPSRELAGLLAQLRLDWGSLGFAAALMLLTGIVAGLVPAWQARALSVNEALRTEHRGSGVGGAALQWQQAMVVFQAAISVLLLVGAALAGIGFRKLTRMPLGFATERRVAFRIELPEPAYATHAQRAAFVRALAANVAREPAIASHGFVSTLPVGDIQWGGGFFPQLANGEFARDSVVFHFRRTAPGYLETIGVPLLEGRLLDERDRADAPPVAVISRSAAEKYWPRRSAVGGKLRPVAPASPRLVEIVGVVGDVRDAGAGLPAGETVYLPWDQVSLRRGWLVMRGCGSAEDTLAAGRRALRATAPGIAAYDATTLDALAWQANALPRLQVALLGVFAVIAIGIAALGSYGVMSQIVANRRREMAIRAALGATRGRVLQLVLWQNARLATMGTAAGLMAAWIAARTLQAKLTGFDASPLWPYVAVAGGVLGLTQVASFIPARRAARLDVPAALTGG